MPHYGKRRGVGSDYDDKCIKVAQLHDKHGVDPSGIRERFGIQQAAVWDMISRGRKLIKGKEDALSNTTGRITSGTVSP